LFSSKPQSKKKRCTQNKDDDEQVNGMK